MQLVTFLLDDEDETQIGQSPLGLAGLPRVGDYINFNGPAGLKDSRLLLVVRVAWHVFDSKEYEQESADVYVVDAPTWEPQVKESTATPD